MANWWIGLVMQASLASAWFSYSYWTGSSSDVTEDPKKEPETAKRHHPPPPTLPRHNTAPLPVVSPRKHIPPSGGAGEPSSQAVKRGSSYGSQPEYSQQWYSYENSGQSVSFSWKETYERSPKDGYACSLSPSSFYDAVFEKRATKSFGLEYRDIEALLAQPHYFVDKSLFIRHWIEDAARVTVFTLPRLYGKSLALSMLRVYLDHRVAPGPGFAKLRINGPEHGTLRQHLGNTCNVVYLDWQAGEVLRASSIADLQVRLRNYLYGLFLDLLDGLRVSRAHLPEGLDLDAYHAYDHFDDFREVVRTMLKVLAAATTRRTVVLVDDYEAVLKKAAELAKTSEDYDAFHVFFQELYAAAFGDPSLYWKACLFGTHRLAADAPFDKLLAEQKALLADTASVGPAAAVAFYEKYVLAQPYAADFGFHAAELELAIKVLGAEVTLESLQAHYTCNSIDHRAMHPYSCAAAIKYGSAEGGYWTRRAPLDPATSFVVSRCPQFGPGDLAAMATSLASFRTASAAVSLRPHEPQSREQALKALLEEGYVTVKAAPSAESTVHLEAVAKAWFDDLTGLHDALRCIADRDFTRLHESLARVTQCQTFFIGNPAMHPDCHRKVNQLIAETIEDAFDGHPAFYFYDRRIPVVKTDPEEYLLFFLPGIKPTVPSEITRLLTEEALKLPQFKHGDNALSLLLAYIDASSGDIQISEHALITRFRKF